MSSDKPVVWPPFADDGPSLALQLPSRTQRETGHTFENCPEFKAERQAQAESRQPPKKRKKIIKCDRCERVRAEIGRRAAVHQREFDEQWYREHPEVRRAY